jgi:hypothetical protein
MRSSLVDLDPKHSPKNPESTAMHLDLESLQSVVIITGHWARTALKSSSYKSIEPLVGGIDEKIPGLPSAAPLLGPPCIASALPTGTHSDRRSVGSYTTPQLQHVMGERARAPRDGTHARDTGHAYPPVTLLAFHGLSGLVQVGRVGALAGGGVYLRSSRHVMGAS